MREPIIQIVVSLREANRIMEAVARQPIETHIDLYVDIRNQIQSCITAFQAQADQAEMPPGEIE